MKLIENNECVICNAAAVVTVFEILLTVKLCLVPLYVIV